MLSFSNHEYNEKAKEYLLENGMELKEVKNFKLVEEKEQNIVTQMIVNTLQPITEELFVDKTHNLRAGNLWHLCNKISLCSYVLQ